MRIKSQFVFVLLISNLYTVQIIKNTLETMAGEDERMDPREEEICWTNRLWFPLFFLHNGVWLSPSVRTLINAHGAAGTSYCLRTYK